MKKTRVSDELCPEYAFDYRRARPNRFAGRVDPGRVVVALDPDVSEVFTTSESVNTVLRALIKAMPKPERRPRTEKPAAGSR